MNVYRISNCKFINDLSGTGAARYAGRWHNKGTHILYTAANSALALLETVVHISTIPIESYCMICLAIPEDKISELSITQLPDDWFANLSPDSIKLIGDSFVKNNQYLALKLPSAILFEESNYLLNPNHADFKLAKVLFSRKVAIDQRLLRIK